MKHSQEPQAPDASKVDEASAVVVPAFGLGRLAPFNWERLPHSTGIRIFWGRACAWLLVLLAVAWLGLASAAYGFVKYRRGFSEVSFQHMVLLPWKLDEYRRSKGEFLIREGLALAEKQEWRAAFGLLRTGLAAVPEHREGRLMTARIYLMAGRPDMVRTLLREGVEYHGDELDYLRQTLGFFFGLQADETVVALTTELRGRLEAGSAARRMAVTALAYAHFNRDRLEEATGVLREERLEATPEGRFVSARVAWERGRREEAIGQLRELTAQVPEDDEIYRTLIFYLNTEGRVAEVRRAALARQLALPERAEAYVDFMVACAAEGDEAARGEAEADFLERFAGDGRALLRLGEAAARAGRVEVVRQVAERCAGLPGVRAEAQRVLLLALLERREYAAVVAAAAELAGEAAKWPEAERWVLGGLKAAALYGLGQELEAEPWVRRLCETRVLPAGLFTALAEQWAKAGQPGQARRLLRHAVEVDPLYQPALAALLRYSLEARDVSRELGLIERLLTMRKPSAELLGALMKELESDRYLMVPGRARVQGEIVERLKGGR